MSAKRLEERLNTPIKKRLPKKTRGEDQAAGPAEDQAMDPAEDQATGRAETAESGPAKGQAKSAESGPAEGAPKAAETDPARRTYSKQALKKSRDFWGTPAAIWKREEEFWSWRSNRTALINECLSAFMEDRPAECLPGFERLQTLVDSISYTLLGGGKRVRALLALATAEAVCGKDLVAIPAAMSVELIHAYSLIHDDLPALDDDDTRRGRPSNHLAFGESTAILAGDALQALAFEALLAPNKIIDDYPKDPARYLSAAFRLSTLCGITGLVGGQFLDLAYEGASPGFEEVLGMEVLKTGHLIAASMLLGAILGGADNDLEQDIFMAGTNAGLAFQVKDDLLNYSGDPARMGKGVGTDAKRGKASLPAIVGPEEAKDMAKTHIRRAIEGVKPLKSFKLERLLKTLVDRDL